MSKVYVVHNSGQYNLEAAGAFGTLVVCQEGKPNVHSPDVVRLTMRNALSGFQETDFLLLVGTVVPVFFAGMYLPQTLSRVQLLLWDVKKAAYFVRTVDLP